MSHLARHLGCDASNITGIVDRLVGHNLLTRIESAKDRRVKVIKLTKKGQQVVDNLKTTLPELLGCTALSAEEREHLYKTLQKLNNHACLSFKDDHSPIDNNT